MLNKIKYILALLVIAGILIDIFIFKEALDWWTLSILLIFLVVERLFQLKAKTILYFTIPLLFFSSVFSIIPATQIVNKISSWAYLFLVIGIVQHLIETQKKAE